jgi:hypothetical protein
VASRYAPLYSYYHRGSGFELPANFLPPAPQNPPLQEQCPPSELKVLFLVFDVMGCVCLLCSSIMNDC